MRADAQVAWMCALYESQGRKRPRVCFVVKKRTSSTADGFGRLFLNTAMRTLEEMLESLGEERGSDVENFLRAGIALFQRQIRARFRELSSRDAFSTITHIPEPGLFPDLEAYPALHICHGCVFMVLIDFLGEGKKETVH